MSRAILQMHRVKIFQGAVTICHALLLQLLEGDAFQDGHDVEKWIVLPPLQGGLYFSFPDKAGFEQIRCNIDYDCISHVLDGMDDFILCSASKWEVGYVTPGPYAAYFE